MGVVIAILVIVLIGATVIGWFAMGNNPVADKIKMIALVYGAGIGLCLLIWFIVEVLSGWILALLIFGAFFSEVFLKK